MYARFVKIPLGIAQILSNGNFVEIPVNDNFEHRPDRVLESIGAESFTDEMFNNQLSIISPISMTKDKTYKVMSTLFRNYFKEG